MTRQQKTPQTPPPGALSACLLRESRALPGWRYFAKFPKTATNAEIYAACPIQPETSRAGHCYAERPYIRQTRRHRIYIQSGGYDT